ncbi:MAG: TonB-dependent receptor [Pseudomonadota bacterium]
MLAIASCLAVLTASSSLAADARPPDESVADEAGVGEAVIDEVVVTATRRAASTSEIAAAVSVIGAEQVRTGQLAIDALANTPGAYVQQTTPGQGAAIIRGLKGSAVLHLVDGMRLNNAIFRSAPTQYFAMLPQLALERIEIVRGTPASLYGSDAVGGVVQAVTRRPRFESAEPGTAGELFAVYESADSARRIGGLFDAGSRRWFATLSAEYLRAGDRRTGGGTRLIPTAYEARSARLALGLTPDADTVWSLDFQYYEQPRTPRVDELLPGFGEDEPASSEFFFAPNRRLYAHARHTRNAGPAGLDWSWSLAWQRIEDDRIARDLDAPVRRFEDNSSDLFGALMTTGTRHERGSWLAGVELYYDRVASARVEESLASGQLSPLTSRFPDGSEVFKGSVFANWTRSATERLSLAAGLRFSEVEVRLAETAASPAAVVRTGDFAGDLGLIVELGGGAQWVSNAGYGFRAPNVFDLGTLGNRPGNRFNIPNTALDSEQVLQFDTGLRYANAIWRFELVAYTLRYEDRIASVGTGGQTVEGRDIVQSVNAARSDVHGLEVGAFVRLADALSLRAVVNYSRGEQRIDGEGEEAADRIPPLSGLLEFAYDASGNWRGEAWLRYAGVQTRLSARDVRDTRIDPNGTPGWAVAGVRVTWSLAARWRLSLAADNLLDKRYRVHGSGLDAPGRNLTLGLRFAF